MKKVFTLLFTVGILNTALFAQGNFEVGSNVLGAGLGLGSSYGYGAYSGTSSPAIVLHYERGMWAVDGPGVISLGGYFAYKGYSYDYGGYSWGSSSMIIGVRSAYHFNMIKSTDWDVYGGLMLGLRSISYDDNYYSISNQSDMIFTAFVGGRYYFNSSWAAFGELGNGIGIMTLGIAYKF